MQVLIINNNTTLLDKLKQMVGKYSDRVEIMDWNKIDFSRTQDFDLIVLSGGTKMAVLNKLEELSDEFELVKKSKKPIIGLCLGFEIISFVFGADLKRREEGEKGVYMIDVVEKDDIFEGKDNFYAYLSHKWYITETPKNFSVLARRKREIQVIKHKKREIYGLQFHPEVDLKNNFGERVFANLVSEIRKL